MIYVYYDVRKTVNGTKLWILDMMFYRFYPAWFSEFHDQSRIPGQNHGEVDPQSSGHHYPYPKVWDTRVCCYRKKVNTTAASKIYGEPSIFTPESLNLGAPACSAAWTFKGGGSLGRPSTQVQPSYHGLVDWLPISLICTKLWTQGQPQKQRSGLVCLGVLDSLRFLTGAW